MAVERVWQRVQAREQPTRPSRFVLVAAPAVLALSLWLYLRTPALKTIDGRRVAVALASGDRELTLSDGSHLQLGDDAKVVAQSVDSKVVSLGLHSGRLDAFVQPGGPRAWRVFAADLRVDVVGTRFTVVRMGEQVQVLVSKGVVRVSGARVPQGIRELHAGESFATDAQETAIPPVEERAPLAPVKPAKKAAEPARRGRSVHDDPPADDTRQNAPNAAEYAPKPDWLALARSGRFAEAAQVLGRSGIERQAEELREMEALLALSDVAAEARLLPVTLAVLTRIIESDAPSQTRALAAYKRGVWLMQLDRPRDAAQSFEQGLALGLPQGFRAHAQERIVDAWMRAQEPARAKAWKNRK